ncbi:uncharacterized protein METZ01_LOCUS119322 [marine metagenome]|uniref:PpiC domain-containing protein n=1 Tax=marine metagenome TaxID=408172 RepID=A0A381XP46_9ZZZZ
MIRKFCTFISLLFFVNTSCEKTPTINLDQEVIIAKIENRVITVNDFLKRCEYSPRPAYCNGDNYIHKKIALNSLIAEKMLALEFDRSDLKISETQKYFIEGQKEQAMRHAMLKKYGYDRVELDTLSLLNRIELRNRTYEVDFMVFRGIDLQNSDKYLNDKTLRAAAFSIGSEKKVSNKTLAFNDQMIDKVRELLFVVAPELNKIHGPYKVADSTFLYLEIMGWVTSVNITEKQKQDTWGSVKNEFFDEQAAKKYSDFVSELMHGKNIIFNPRNFENFAEKVAKVYIIERSKKENIIQNYVWESDNKMLIKILNQIDKMENDNILYHDGKDWTLDELMTLIRKHPLVFRKKDIGPDQFTNELKSAIADLLRDLHITQRGYDIGLDDDVNVKQVTEKWRDYVKSVIIKEKYSGVLQNNLSMSRNKFPNESLVNKIDSLQIAYSKYITINTGKFEKIHLSSIDLFAMYSNQAYNSLEPSFPILTDDHLLDYGLKITPHD